MTRMSEVAHGQWDSAPSWASGFAILGTMACHVLFCPGMNSKSMMESMARPSVRKPHDVGRLRTILFAALALGACSADGGADTEVRGVAQYDDAETESDGQPREAASPAATESMRVEITAKGNGQLEGLRPDCSLDGASGRFEGLYSGQGRIDEDGVYLASLASGSAAFTTPSGCEVPDLEVSAYTEIVVRAELEASERNCQAYCSARGRSAAESECDVDDATCRSEAEASYAGECTASCTSSSSHRLVAEASLSASALAEVSAAGLAGKALGSLLVDLRFDRIEDEDGEEVSETP